jgi:hypothetical protein
MTAAPTTPPVPRRDESRVAYAGVGPPGRASAAAAADPPPPIRQSGDSPEALMDPPATVPDPYGWMRDDERANDEVLEHLRAENEYSGEVAAHLGGLRDELYGEFLSG